MNTPSFSARYLALVPIAALFATSCISKRSQDGKRPLALAITAPAIPAELRLAEAMVLTPFQYSLRIEGATGVVYEGQLTAGQDLSLMVPPGELKFSASFMGFFMPAGIPASAMCKTENPEPSGTPGTTGPDQGGGGDDGGGEGGPDLMLYSSKIFNVTPAPDGVVNIEFPQAVVAQMKRFALKLEGLPATVLSTTKLEYTDPATGVLLKGPCPDSIGDSFKADGKLAEKFPFLRNGEFGFVLVAGETRKPFKAVMSATDALKNFFLVNVPAGTISLMAPTEDFDGDGVSNGDEVAQNRNPFEGMTSSFYADGQTGPDGKFFGKIYSHNSDVPLLSCRLNKSAEAQPCSRDIAFCNKVVGVCEPLPAGSHEVTISGTDRDGFTIPPTVLAFNYGGAGGCGMGCGGPVGGPFALSPEQSFPSIGAGGVDVASNVVLSFDRPLNMSSLAGKVKIRKTSDNSEIDCAAFYQSEKGIVCKPSALLAGNTEYRVIVLSGILAADGSALTSGADWGFVTAPPSNVPLMVEHVWPSVKDRKFIDRSVHFGIKFNRSLDITKPIVATLYDTYTASNVESYCEYREDYMDNRRVGSIECRPENLSTHTEIPLVPGRRYEVGLQGGITGVNDNYGGYLLNNVRTEFTVYNNPTDNLAPQIVRHVPALSAPDVRQDAVFGAFFNEPVSINDWNLNSPMGFFIKDNAGVVVQLDSCQVIEDLNGFLCRRMDPLPVGAYTATIKAGVARDFMNNVVSTDSTWPFTVVATPNLAEFVRVFEHPSPVATVMPNLTRLNVMAVFNHQIDFSTTNNSSLSVAMPPTPSPTPAGFDNMGWQQPMFDGFGYMLTRESLMNPGNYSVSFDPAIRDISNNALTTLERTWNINASMPPPLMITERYPMPGETVSKYTSIVITFNKPIYVSSGTMVSTDVQLLNSSLNPVTCNYSGFEGGFTNSIKIQPMSPLNPSETYKFRINKSGTIFSALDATQEYSFTVASAETKSYVTYAYPRNGNMGPISTSASVGVNFNREVAINQPSGVFEICEIDVSNNCVSTAVPSPSLTLITNHVSASSSLQWMPSVVLQSSKSYRVTVKNIEEKSGAVWSTPDNYSWTFLVDSGVVTPPPNVHTNFIIADASPVYGLPGEYVVIGKVHDPLGSGGALAIQSPSNTCSAAPVFDLQFLGPDHQIKMQVPSIQLPLGCTATFVLMNNQGKSTVFSGEIAKVSPIVLVAPATSGGETGLTGSPPDDSTLGTLVPPSMDCGLSGDIASSIGDCATKNPSSSHFDDASMPKKYSWVLIARSSGGAVWRDNLTGLIWSDKIFSPSSANWCHASGSNNKVGSPFAESDSTCSNNTYQSQTAPVSLCAEDTVHLNGTMTSSPAKGYLGKLSPASNPEVVWRLPSITDWKLAWKHGAKKVLPNMIGDYWSNTVDSSNRVDAWTFLSDSGSISPPTSRNTVKVVRCVGSGPSY